MNQEYTQRLKGFIQKLWQNPAMMQLPLDRKENQVLIFLRDNRPKLQQVFNQPDYFPGVSWDEVLRGLLHEMIEELVRIATPLVENVVKKATEPDVCHHFAPSVSVDAEAFRDLILDSMRQKAFRAQVLPVLQLIQLDYFEKYIPEAMNRRKYIYNELIRHDRLKMGVDEIPRYLDLASLFRPFNYLLVQTPTGQNVMRAKVLSDRTKEGVVTNVLKSIIREKIGPVPNEIMDAGLASIESKEENPDLAGSAKLIGIMAMRAADYNPAIKQDRGAESADKSWFHINRRNAKVYGLDADLLDELYQIAGEKGW